MVMHTHAETHIHTGTQFCRPHEAILFELLLPVSPSPTLSPQTGAIWLELCLTCSSGRTGGHQRELFKLLPTLIGGGWGLVPEAALEAQVPGIKTQRPTPLFFDPGE